MLDGKRTDSDCNARTYKDDVNGPRFTLHRDLLIDRAMSIGQPLESFSDVVELLKREEVFGELVPQLANLVKIMHMLPTSTCTAERSFSGLRRLKSDLRSEIKQQRLDSVAINNVHQKKLKSCRLLHLLMILYVEPLFEKHFLPNQAVT